MNWHRITILFSLFGILLLSHVVLAEGPPPVVIESTIVTSQTLLRSIEAQGEVKPFKHVTMQADISGRVANIDFDEGKPVEANKVVMTLDDSVYQAQLAQAKAKMDHSQVNYGRLKKLLDRGTGSPSDVEQALATLEYDKASVALAKANLAKTRIKTPFAGVLGLKSIDVGDFVSTGQPLLDIVDIDNLIVDFFVPEKYIAEMKQGLSVSLNTDVYADANYQGEVVAIAPTLNTKLRALKVRAIVHNPNHILKPGVFSRLSIVLQTIENAMVVPEDALFYQDSKPYLYLIEDNHVKPIQVTTGMSHKGMVQILEGVKAGDSIVLAGQIKLYDGAAVIESKPE